MRRLCVFPNDPLIMYYNKGEIKDRYLNPNNIFDEIHVISFTDHETEVKNVQKMAGSAKLIIHCVGKIKVRERERHIDRQTKKQRSRDRQRNWLTTREAERQIRRETKPCTYLS